jgi:inorganic pyrophosphatase
MRSLGLRYLQIIKLHIVQGPEGTFDYRMFMTEGELMASFWHDIPLDNGDGTVNFVCEIPKETKAKMEVATVHFCNPLSPLPQ